ncbi:MAG: hypothetical protein WC449_00635 [Candidatus Paceibacterota bacterium]
MDKRPLILLGALAILSLLGFLFNQKQNVVVQKPPVQDNSPAVNITIQKGDFSITFPFYWQEAGSMPGASYTAFNTRHKAAKDSTLGPTYATISYDQKGDWEFSSYKSVVKGKLAASFEGLKFIQESKEKSNGGDIYFIEAQAGKQRLLIMLSGFTQGAVWEVVFVTTQDYWDQSREEFYTIARSFQPK